MHNKKNINPLCGYIYCNNLKHLNKNLFDNPYVDKLDSCRRRWYCNYA